MVRLLTAALAGLAIRVAGRITGVLPREIFDGRERLILRSAPGSVGEMEWWLRTLPESAEGVVMENSAVAPELQGLAWNWLRPACTVLTNVRPDHEEVWGRGEASAARVLCSGIGGGTVVLPASVAKVKGVGEILEEKGCILRPCPEGRDFRTTHLNMVAEVCAFFGLDYQKALSAACALPPDLADFQVFTEGEGRLASAFSANDPESTEALFQSTGWDRRETTILFNARKDRVGRLRAFRSFLGGSWKSVVVTGSRPLFLPRGAKFIPLKGRGDLVRFVSSAGLVLGCGNVAGTPLKYLLKRASLEGDEKRI